MQKNFANFSLQGKIILEYGNLDLEKNVKAEICQNLSGLREPFCDGSRLVYSLF